MTILITGGAGFIGSHFIEIHRKTHPEDRIICLDKLTYAADREFLRAQEQDPQFRSVQADICDRAAVFQLFQEERPEIVVNFAAETHVDRSIADPGIFLKTNIEGVGVLLDACLAFGGVRLHQISTDEAYGDLPLDRPDLAFTEEAPLKGSSPYAASKAAADLLVLSYFRTYGLPVTISRCSNNYGTRQYPEKLIPLMVDRAIHDQKLPLYGDGLHVRDWIHVEDHCRAVEQILAHGRIGTVYNVGASNEISNMEIVHCILQELGKPESLIEHVEDRKGHDRRYAIDASRLREELGWKPEVPFAEGLRETIRWYADRTKR